MNESLLKFFAFGTILIFLFLLCCLILDFLKIKHPIRKIINVYKLELLFIFSLSGTVGSLLLSIYFKLTACELCWYQRIFLFTIPIISMIALYKKDILASVYIFWLSTIGFILAFYHSLLQSGLFKKDTVFCNPNSFIDCSIPSFTYFGFVTVPVIACGIFLILMYISYGTSKK